jgi:putative Mg2+ transporter-C (MgtC) family protein
MNDLFELGLRLVYATVVCGAIRLNRGLRGKPIGVRTLGLVGLTTAALIVGASGLSALDGAPHMRFSDAESRVVQGILTGVGFLGAGVIFHRGHHMRAHGLTSAACVWVAAGLGVICGAGWWLLAGLTTAMALLVLGFGGPIERYFHRVLGGERAEAEAQSSEAPHHPGR